MTSNSAMNYDDFIDVYNINMNRNNAGNVSLEFEQRLKYLRSLSAADRVMEIREMEVDIVSFENCTVYRDRIKQHSKRVSECEVVLTELHAQVAAQEKEMRLFYTSLTNTYERSKLTSSEFNHKKSQNQMKAKAHQIKLDQLLNLTLYQLKIYENLQAELKNEKKEVIKIRHIIEQIKKLLNEAKCLKQEMKQNEIKSENVESLQRCMEVRQVPVSPTYTESKEINDKKPQKIVFKKRKPKFKTKPIIVPNKKKNFNKIESTKHLSKKKVNNKKLKKKVKPQIKEDVISNETKVTEHSPEEKKIEEKPIEALEKDKPVNVGCCKPRKPRKIAPKHDHSDKSSLKESLKSGKERSKSIKEDSITTIPNIVDEDKSKKTTLSEMKTPEVIKKKRSNTPKSQSKTNSLKSHSHSSRSNTSKSRPKKSPLKSKNKKNNVMKSKSPSKNENEEKNKVENKKENENENELENETIEIIENIQPEKENLEEQKDKSEYIEMEKKKENRPKRDFLNEKSKICFLKEDEIMDKIKENQFQYESSFPKGYYKVSDVKERKECDPNEKKPEVEEDPRVVLLRLKNERNEKLKLEEKDRQIIKSREYKVIEMNEKERIKKRNKELEDHEHYLKTLKKNKKYLNTNSDEVTPKAEVGEIEKLPKVKYDYQILLLESKNAVNESKHSKLYKVRDPEVKPVEKKNEISLEEKYFEERYLLEESIEHIPEPASTTENDINKEIVEDEPDVLEKENVDTTNVNDSTAVLKTDDDEKKTEVTQEKSQEKEALQKESINDNDKVSEVKKEENTEIQETLEEKKIEKKVSSEKNVKENKEILTIIEPEIKKVEVTNEKNDGGCCGKVQKEKKPHVREDIVKEVEEETIVISTEISKNSSEVSSVVEEEPQLVAKQTTEEIYVEELIEFPKTQSESESDDKNFTISENEINNPKFWKQNIYHVELKGLFERKIGCVIRAKPGGIPKRKMIVCKLILSSEEIPQLDQREDYMSYIFKIYPRNDEVANEISFDTPWHVAIPFYLPERSTKEPLIMQMSEDKSHWIEYPTNDVVFDNLKNTGLKFVETKVQNPFGTYAVVSFLNKDRTIVNKDGTQLTSTSDRNVTFSVPPDAIRISINTSLRVTSLDPVFWKEIKEKHEKTALDSIYMASSVVEIEAKKKKLTSPAILSLSMPTDTPKVESVPLKKRATTESEDPSSKHDDEKTKKILNSFQKTLLMPNVNSAQNMQDVHFLSYMTDEERWSIINNPKLNYDKSKEQINIELPALQSSKYILLKSKRKTADESLTKAAKIIDHELCVRNCVVALFQSTKLFCDFALTVSLKKYFQKHVNHLQDEGFLIDPANKLTYMELKERQILKLEFVGNIRNVIVENNVTEFAFHSLFPNTQKFRVREIDGCAQKAIASFRGYADLTTNSIVKRPVQSADGKTRKTNIQYTWVEENILISHLLISIKKKRIPKISSFFNFKFNFKNFFRCVEIIKKVSTKMGAEWWELGILLNVTETRMHSIKLHNQDKGIPKMAEQMLIFWLKGCETNENKYDLLTKALKGCGRQDIAERLQKPQERLLVFGC